MSPARHAATAVISSAFVTDALAFANFPSPFAHFIMTTAQHSSKKPWAGLLILVLAGIAVGLWMHDRGDHAAGHDHAHHDSSALSLDDGKRWATDAPLRLGMERIRNATTTVVARRTTNGVDAATAASLSNAINENVNYLIANCKLPPKADAALHVIITDLLTGAGALNAHPESPEGLDRIIAALRVYPEYFDHPQWQPLDAHGS